MKAKVAAILGLYVGVRFRSGSFVYFRRLRFNIEAVVIANARLSSILRLSFENPWKHRSPRLIHFLAAREGVVVETILCPHCQAAMKGAYHTHAESASPAPPDCLFCGASLAPVLAAAQETQADPILLRIYAKTDGCQYQTYKNLCLLWRQRSERGLADQAWSPHPGEEGRCVFSGADPINGRFCPAFRVDQPGKIARQSEFAREAYNTELRLSGGRIGPGDPLYEAVRQFGHTDILFCLKEGVVNSSYCLYCRNYSGKHRFGDTEKRRASSCRGPAEHIGKIVDDELHFYDQYHVDRIIQDMSQRLFLKVPFSSKFIQSCYSTEATDWDPFQYSDLFCTRCGPAKTKGVHYACRNCRTRRLCDNCVVDLDKKVAPDNSIETDYTCPDCGHQNQFRDGPNRTGEALYGAEGLYHATLREPFSEVSYWLIKERRLLWLGDRARALRPLGAPSNTGEGMISAAIQWLSGLKALFSSGAGSRKNQALLQEALQSPLPTPDSRPFQVQDGLLEGVYFIDDYEQRAFLYVGDDYKILSLRGASAALDAFAFTVDVVLSYRTADLSVAKSLRDRLRERDVSCFLVEAAENEHDLYWRVRFATALFKARIAVICASQTYFEANTATEFEMREMLSFAAHRRKLFDQPGYEHLYVYPLEKDAARLAGAVPVTASIDAIVEAVRQAPDGKAYFAKLRQMCSQGLEARRTTVNPKDPHCPNCGRPIFFSEHVAHLDWRKLPQDRTVALHCILAHRYCLECGGRDGDHRDKTCPLCLKAGQRNGGYSHRADQYLQGRFVFYEREKIARN